MTGYLDAMNLVPAFIALSTVGALLCAYVAVDIGNGHIASDESQTIRNGRRIGVVILGVALLWGLDYGNDRSWQPWPPYLIMIVGLDLWLGMIVAASCQRKRMTREQRSTESTFWSS